MVASAFHFDFVKGGTKLPLTPGATPGYAPDNLTPGYAPDSGNSCFDVARLTFSDAPERPQTPPDCGSVDSFAAKHN